MKFRHGMVLFMASAMSLPVFAAGDVAKGETLYQVCAGCHGSKGEGSESTGAPRLAGQYEWYLVNQLNNFKSGARGGDERDAKGAIMVSMANTLANDQAVEDVVEYIMTLNPKKYKYKAN